MPQIKKKGAIFPIFADSPSPPRSSAAQSSSPAQSGSPTRPAATRKSSYGASASSKPKTAALATAPRKALSQKSSVQVVRGGLRDGQAGLGKGKSAEGKVLLADLGKPLPAEKTAAPSKPTAPSSHAPPSSRGHVRSATETSIYAGRPNLRKKPATGGSFAVFTNENASTAPYQTRKSDVKPSLSQLAKPITLSPADKENQPPAREAPAPVASGRCAPAPAVWAADVFAEPAPLASTSSGVLDLEALGSALMGPPSAPASGTASSRASSSMTLGYGRGRQASRPLQSAFAAAGLASMDTEASEILEDEETEPLDPSLMPPFNMGTPARRTTHSRTSSTQSIQESPSKWPAAVLSQSTATPLKRQCAPPKRASPVGADVVGLGIGFGGASGPGLDMRFEPDPVLGDVSEAYGADRSAEPSGFRRDSGRSMSRQPAHAQKDSWSGAWGADVASYPTARR